MLVDEGDIILGFVPDLHNAYNHPLIVMVTLHVNGTFSFLVRNPEIDEFWPLSFEAKRPIWIEI